VTLLSARVAEQVEAGMVALRSGPWTNQLLDRSGCPAEDRMPITPQKRMLFMTDFPDQDPRWATIPLTIIDQGIYFKCESGSLMIGKAREDTPSALDTTFEPDYYVEEINLVMQERMPATATCKLKRGWAHMYDTNSADHNAILGWHGNHPGLLLQVGYSGHGAMESPAVGVSLAELVITGKYQSIDCTPLRWRPGAGNHRHLMLSGGTACSLRSRCSPSEDACALGHLWTRPHAACRQSLAAASGLVRHGRAPGRCVTL
jgi:glycine/D-amino acid oxidase-like deaminating enzyme